MWIRATKLIIKNRNRKFELNFMWRLNQNSKTLIKNFWLLKLNEKNGFLIKIIKYLKNLVIRRI